MCQFCVEHGEGERWYLQAKNYAYDLESDLRRREYVVDFIAGFETMRTSALKWSARLNKLPAPIARAGGALITARQQRHHFGQPVPLEECEQILDLATSITLIPCICRMHTPGKRADQVCMLVTTRPITDVLEEGFSGYDDGPTLDDFQVVDKASAMQLLQTCEESGLMHSVWTFQTPFTAAICNCNVESGCMAMRLTAVHDIKVMWRGEWVAEIDDAPCRRCGACARVCPFDAIRVDGRRVTLDPSACWGCGVCRRSCGFDAIRLHERATIPLVADRW